MCSSDLLVSAALQSGADVATRQADIASQQVTLLQSQLSALNLINTSVLSVSDALAAYNSARNSLTSTSTSAAAAGNVAINAAKFKVTGKKMADKMYYSHSGFPGGFKEITLAQLAEKDARRVIEKAVKGMLPKNKLQQTRLRRLKLYLDDKHPYAVELGLKTKNQELTTKN